MHWANSFFLFLGLAISGCAVSVQRLSPPAQPEPTTTRVTEMQPEPGVTLTAAPGDTLLRVKNYAISERTINTHMWRPESDFAIDVVAWPEYSATTDNIYVALGTTNWHSKDYYVLDDEDGNISWGVAKNAHLLLNEDGTFDGVMGVETGTFKTKIVRGPDPVTFTKVVINKTEIISDESYTNFEIIFIDRGKDEIVLARREYNHDSKGAESIKSEKIFLLDTNLGGYAAGNWRIEIQPSDGPELAYLVSSAAP